MRNRPYILSILSFTAMMESNAPGQAIDGMGNVIALQSIHVGHAVGFPPASARATILQPHSMVPSNKSHMKDMAEGGS